MVTNPSLDSQLRHARTIVRQQVPHRADKLLVERLARGNALVALSVQRRWTCVLICVNGRRPSAIPVLPVRFTSHGRPLQESDPNPSMDHRPTEKLAGDLPKYLEKFASTVKGGTTPPHWWLEAFPLGPHPIVSRRFARASEASNPLVSLPLQNPFPLWPCPSQERLR
jgi:hypothetical protein